MDAPHDDTFGFLPTRRRAVPAEETPSQGAFVAMVSLWLLACAISAIVVFNL